MLLFYILPLFEIHDGSKLLTVINNHDLKESVFKAFGKFNSEMERLRI